MSCSFEECKALFQGKLYESMWNQEVEKISSFFSQSGDTDVSILSNLSSKLPPSSVLKEVVSFKNHYYVFYLLKTSLYYKKFNTSLEVTGDLETATKLHDFPQGIKIFKTFQTKSGIEFLVYDSKELYISSDLSVETQIPIKDSVVFDVSIYQHNAHQYFFLLTKTSVLVYRKFDGKILHLMTYKFKVVDNMSFVPVSTTVNSETICFLFSNSSTISVLPINVKQTIAYIEDVSLFSLCFSFSLVFFSFSLLFSLSLCFSLFLFVFLLFLRLDNPF